MNIYDDREDPVTRARRMHNTDEHEESEREDETDEEEQKEDAD